MSKTLLIYERAVPVNKERHGKWGVKTDNDFGFAREVNSMPLLAQEFRAAVREYPIVFAGTEDAHAQVVMGRRRRRDADGPHRRVVEHALHVGGERNSGVLRRK